MLDVLKKMKGQLITAYQRHTDLSTKEISKMMDDETWMTAKDAKDFGFITEISEIMEIAACFDSSKYKAPEGALAVFHNNNSQKEDFNMWAKLKNVLKGKGLKADSDETAVQDFVEGMKTPEEVAAAVDAGQIEIAAKLAEKESEFANKVATLEAKAKEDAEALAKAFADIETEKKAVADSAAKLADLEAKHAKLLPALVPPPQDSEKSGKEEFFAAVKAKMEADGITQESATLAVQRDNPELHKAMLEEAN
jgi:hypothetical protein